MDNRKRNLLIVSYIVGILSIFWYKQRQKMTYSDINRFYNVQLDQYTTELQETYKQLHVDDGTKDFLEWSTTRSNSFVLQIFYAISAPLLNIFTTKTATNGILYRGEMFVLSKNQLMSLLGNEKISRQVDDHQIDEPHYQSWLDLGAGDGGALERLGARQMAEKVMVTEICTVMKKRLSWRGFEVKDTDHWDDQTYDIISMFNLLDRAGDPDQFLNKAHAALNPDGKLIIAVVLPFKPYVERGGINNRPVIDVQSYQSVSRHHCDQLDTFVMAVQNRGFRLTSWSVVPYLCEGDQTTAYYTLRDTILIFDKL